MLDEVELWDVDKLDDDENDFDIEAVGVTDFVGVEVGVTDGVDEGLLANQATPSSSFKNCLGVPVACPIVTVC